MSAAWDQILYSADDDFMAKHFSPLGMKTLFTNTFTLNVGPIIPRGACGDEPPRENVQE
jgi:hypothetical protein